MSYPSFTSESVCAGHPDKICDQISDAILDAVLEQDPHARVAVETAVTNNRIIILGEVTTNANVDYEQVARRQVARLGYTDPSLGFSDQAHVEVYVGKQSPEIAQGVDNEGAGDQGMMFGYACHETPELMPLPIALAHSLTRAIDQSRESKKLPFLLPDGKAQVTIQYKQDKPSAVTHITFAVPHQNDITLHEVRAALVEEIITPVLAEFGFAVPHNAIVVNGTGAWHTPGPASDAGLTGRKIIVDSYGGYARTGGGAFSGKDPTKVDRSGAYAARFIAKQVVAANLADRAEVALAYHIGAKQAIMKEVETFGTAHVSDAEITKFIDELLITSVAGIIDKFSLRRPIYLATAAYGHFGRSEFPWEQVVVPAQARI